MRLNQSIDKKNTKKSKAKTPTIITTPSTKTDAPHLTDISSKNLSMNYIQQE